MGGNFSLSFITALDFFKEKKSFQHQDLIDRVEKTHGFLVAL